jgi:xanthine dehydrogenase accessory factor
MNEVYQALAKLKETNQSGALCTIIETEGSTPRHAGSKMLVYPDGSIVGTVGGGEVEGRIIRKALEVLSSGESEILNYNLVDPSKGDAGVCGGSLQVFIEPIHSADVLLVIGGGHVGKAVVHLGIWLGFRVILSDDRPEFCNQEMVPGADEYISCLIEELPSKVEFTPRTAVVLATRNMEVDTSGLPEILQEDSAYIGVISSRRRWALTRKALLELGVAETDIDRIFAPIGLDLRAETPEEIALSILGEVIMIKRGGQGGTLSE